MRRAWVVVMTVGAVWAAVGGANAQDPAEQPRTVFVLGDEEGLFSARRVLSGSVTVVAGGVECVTHAPNGGDLLTTVVVGLPTQPEECRREGARITFFDGAGRQLVEEAAVSPGATIRIVNLAPHPPSSGPVALPGSGSGGLGEAGGTGTWTVVAIALAAAGALSAGMGVRRARS